MYRKRRLLPALVGACLVLGAGARADACAIDGKPSAFANGVRAVITAGAPTAQTYAWWAHFTFPIAFRVGEIIHFKEDDATLRKVLRPAWLTHPWRWRFSDGSLVVGDTSTHAFRRRGHYRVYVEAYVPSYGYAPFDTITVTLRP